MYYTRADLHTDSGILVPDWNTKSFLEYDHTRTGTNQIVDDNEFFRLMFYLTHKTYHYQRQYIKMPEISARVGGFMNLFIMLLNYVWGFYIDNEYSTYLIGKVFKLEIEDEDTSPLKLPEKKEEVKEEEPIQFKNKRINIERMAETVDPKIKGERVEIVDISHSSISDLTMQKYSKTQQAPEENAEDRFYQVGNKENVENLNRSIAAKENISNLIEERRKATKEIKIDPCEKCYFKYMCCFGNRLIKKNPYSRMRFELIKAAEEELRNKTEISNLLATNDQFGLLKMLILNQFQCFMLENRERHFILNKRNCDLLGELRDLSGEKKQKKESELISYLKTKRNENSLSDIDNILFRFLNKDLKRRIKSHLK